MSSIRTSPLEPVDIHIQHSTDDAAVQSVAGREEDIPETWPALNSLLVDDESRSHEIVRYRLYVDEI